MCACIHDICVYNKICLAFAICLDNIHSFRLSSVLTRPFVSTHMQGVFLWLKEISRVWWERKKKEEPRRNVMSVLYQVFKFQLPWQDGIETERVGSVQEKIFETPGMRRVVLCPRD